MVKEKLYKTTIVIYTDTNVTHCSLQSIGHEADTGDAICEKQVCVAVDADKVPSGVRSFFGIEGDN